MRAPLPDRPWHPAYSGERDRAVPDFVNAHAGDFPDRSAAPPKKDRTDAAIEKTRRSFRYQWTVFREMVIDFRENFFYYSRPLDETFFRGKLGLDMGCGFGRHIYYAALFGAEMVGVDLSDAIESTAENVRELNSVHLIQADVYHLPFRPGVFDSRTHRRPASPAGSSAATGAAADREVEGLRLHLGLARSARERDSTARAVTDACRRRCSRRCHAFAYGRRSRTYQTFASVPAVGALMKKLPLPRLRLYTHYPFQVVYADWFDRFAAPIRFYYDENDLSGWVSRAKLTHTSISPTGLFGWRAYGERE
jgi:SAM-dependent methyltransferase